MKTLSLVSLFLASTLVASERAQNTVILDENTVANLRLEFASAEPRVFEETVFALGRLEARHDAIAVSASRISGRVISLSAHLGDPVEADAELMRIESRQAGDPPPVITLRAPRAGIITACEIHLGDPIEPDRHLLEITDLSTLEAVARVPESALGRLRIGETDTRIRLAAFPGETFTARLVRIADSADTATGTVEARFELPNPEGRFRPGLRAEFSIVTAHRPDVLAVPLEAVQGEGVGPRFVFVKDSELPNAFVKTPVVLGATNDRHIEIVSGLVSGREVVTRGAYSLAFAGSGGVSLKEALDAAHGHEHAADGSELGSSSHGHDHDDHDDHDHDDHAHPERPWQIATAVLGLASLFLLIALARRRHA